MLFKTRLDIISFISYIRNMNQIDPILSRFTSALQPHELFFISRGHAPWRWHREENLPDNVTPCAYLDAAPHDLRAAAHGDVTPALALLRQAGPNALPRGVFEALVQWAVVELKLGTISSFGAFALLLRAVAGDTALPWAASLYAAAALEPRVQRPQRLDAQAFSDMAELATSLTRRVVA